MSSEEGHSETQNGLANIETKTTKQDEEVTDDDNGSMSMSSFYSLDKPKDALSGSTQGIGNILKGLCHA